MIRKFISGIVRSHPVVERVVDGVRKILFLLQNPELRKENRRQRVRLNALRKQIEGRNVTRLSERIFKRTVLIHGMAKIESILFQIPVIWGFMLAGYRPVVFLYDRAPVVEAAYSLLGIDSFSYLSDYLSKGDHPEAVSLMEKAKTEEDPLLMTYRGISSVKFAVSSLMRSHRLGEVDFSDPSISLLLQKSLSDSLHYTDVAERMIDHIKPDAILLVDKGYTPVGQLSEVCLKRGVPPFTLNSSHREASILLKRYHVKNFNWHYHSLSPENWERTKAMPWGAHMGERLFQEFKSCYRSGEWFSEVGTQFNKHFDAPDALIERLGLDRTKKTAFIFPHLFWDATFFWGNDIFPSYKHWFIATIKAACANEQLNWVVKVHPSNIIKDSRDGYEGENSEIIAIRESVGPLPGHVKLIPSDSDISTWSLFPIMDFCVTVRGTVGIEAACFGIPVITAGTGRYDAKGFTLDPSDKDEFLRWLADFPAMPDGSEIKSELAQMFAYSIFFARPTPINSVTMRRTRNRKASLEAYLNLPPEGPIECEDVKMIADWVHSKEDDFFVEEELVRNPKVNGDCRNFASLATNSKSVANLVGGSFENNGG